MSTTSARLRLVPVVSVTAAGPVLARWSHSGRSACARSRPWPVPQIRGPGRSGCRGRPPRKDLRPGTASTSDRTRRGSQPRRSQGMRRQRWCERSIGKRFVASWRRARRFAFHHLRLGSTARTICLERSTSRCEGSKPRRAGALIPIGRSSCTARTLLETLAHEPRAGSRPSGSPRCTTTERACRTGREPACLPRGRTRRAGVSSTWSGGTCRRAHSASASAMSVIEPLPPDGTHVSW